MIEFVLGVVVGVGVVWYIVIHILDRIMGRGSNPFREQVRQFLAKLRDIVRR